MGVTIYCKKGSSIDMGYFGFKRLRDKISELYGGEWWEHCQVLEQNMVKVFAHDNEWLDAYDAETERLIRDKVVPVKFVDFIMQCDCGGSIHYGACKLILKVIGDYDDDLIYGYAGRENPARFKDFKRLLEECVEKKCDLVWS